jgi:hypothetical protein
MSLLPTRVQLLALAITLLTESCGAAGVAVSSSQLRRPLAQIVKLILLVNLVTHSIFWYTLPLLPGEATVRLFAYEIAITLVEGMIYQRLLRYRFWQGLLVSGLLNALSYSFGGFVWWFVV